MSIQISDEFKQYADFSVRVDRFFNVCNIYGMHHESLKAAFALTPGPETTDVAVESNYFGDEIKRFLLIASTALNYMGTTNIFSDKGSIDSSTISDDMLNFSFYTCYCFQWTLFENFIKKMIRSLIVAELLPLAICTEIEKRWLKTQKFLDYLDSGEVFGHSPFRTALPVPGWVPDTERCDYSDLDRIRKLRNDFIHGIEAPEINSENVLEKQRKYARSMWILRNFALNVQHEVQALLIAGVE